MKQKGIHLPAAILLIILFFNSDSSYAQDFLTFENVEARSFELYKNQRWNELIRLGNRALDEGIDSYSLRTYLGTAYYKLKNYAEAIPSFEKALEIGLDDELILEYLYYCYMFLGRNMDKNFIFSKLSNYKKTSLRPLYNSFIDNIFAESGKSAITEFYTDDVTLLVLLNNSYGEQIIPGDEFYFNAGLNQLPFNRLNISYEYSYINSKKSQEIYSGASEYSNEYNRKQNRFYNKFDILAMSGLTISPAAHYINIKENKLAFDSITSSELLNFSKREFSIENFILSIAASEHLSIFRIGINGSFSYLNEKHQTQYGLSFAVFPFGNARLTGTTEATLHYQDKVSNLIIAQSVGLTIIKNLDLFTTAGFGKISNFNFDNGRSVYNDPDLLKVIIDAGLTYSFTNNLSAKISFNHQHRERKFMSYNTFGTTAFESGSAKYDYYVNTFSAGIKFYF